MRGGDVAEMLLVCLHVHVCVCVCVCAWRVYEGVALEYVFHLLSHGCHCDGRVGAAVAHGNQISLCIQWGGGQHVPHFPIHEPRRG